MRGGGGRGSRRASPVRSAGVPPVPAAATDTPIPGPPGSTEPRCPVPPRSWSKVVKRRYSTPSPVRVGRPAPRSGDTPIRGIDTTREWEAITIEPVRAGAPAPAAPRESLVAKSWGACRFSQDEDDPLRKGLRSDFQAEAFGALGAGLDGLGLSERTTVPAGRTFEPWRLSRLCTVRNPPTAAPGESRTCHRVRRSCGRSAARRKIDEEPVALGPIEPHHGALAHGGVAALATLRRTPTQTAHHVHRTRQLRRPSLIDDWALSLGCSPIAGPGEIVLSVYQSCSSRGLVL